jgi:YD repeat-containing protein
MDRRQLMYGMAATGMAVQLNLPGLNAQTVNPAQPSRKSTILYPPDLEHDEPRGPIKSCIEETQGLDGSVMTSTHEYDADGKMISSRTEQDGKLLDSSPLGPGYSEVRDADGRLIKTTTTNREGQSYDVHYTYDSSGRMLTTNTDNGDGVEYSYGPDGLMTATHTFDPKTIEELRRGGFTGSPWEAAEVGIGVPSGGRVLINCDENNEGTEMRILTADGKVVTHMVRMYDLDGRLLEEKTLEQNRGLLFLDGMPAEQRALLSPEQIQAFAEQLNALEPKNAGAKYTYDSEGRLTKMQERNFAFERTKTRVYNEHGDRVEEREEFRENPATSTSNRLEGLRLPEGSVRRYAYKYDSHGNWIERITTWGDGSSSSTTRRTLTYYDK